MATQTDEGKAHMLHVPLVKEALVLGRRTVDSGAGVRVHKTVSEETWRVDDTVQRQQLEIEHVTCDVWVDGEPPTQRHEGATLVIPVLEEVLVVQKRVRLKEEIRITARSQTVPVSASVVLRSEHASIERFAVADAPEADADHAAKDA